MRLQRSCPICGGTCAPLDVVDFNKSCEEYRSKFLPLAGIPVYYVLCEICNFCFAPDLYEWSLEEFSRNVYNDEYIQVDPDYSSARPGANAEYLLRLFGGRSAEIAHLDFGGGNGLLSDLLRDSGWSSKSYDPFVDRDVKPANLGKYDLVTAFEVFEHVPNVRGLASDLSSLLKDRGVVLFTTLLSDGKIARNQRVTWWYASPRNGHISLFSRNSLYRMAANEGMKFGSFSDNLHAFWRRVPDWAKHVLPDG